MNPAAAINPKKYAELQRDIAIGVAQIQRGEYTEYDDASRPGLLETIRSRGQERLN